jgi:hypothetical protein
MSKEEYDAVRARWKKERIERELQQDIGRPHSTTESRYISRAHNIWDTRRFGGIRYYFWWVIHNTVVHPVLGLVPCRLTFKWHDWASRKLNGK